MDQMTFGLDPLPKKTCKEVFLAEMNRVVPLGALFALIQPHLRGAPRNLWIARRQVLGARG